MLEKQLSSNEDVVLPPVRPRESPVRPRESHLSQREPLLSPDALKSIQDQCEEVYNKVRISIFDVQSVVDSIEGNQSTYTDFRTTPNRDEEPLISSLVMTNNLVPTVAGTDDTNPIVLD